MHEDTTLTFNANILPSIARFVSSQQYSSQCISQTERHLLSSFLSAQLPKQALPIQQLLDSLASLLLRPCLTTCVSRLFRPILLDLVGRWILALKDTESAQKLFATSCMCEERDNKQPITATVTTTTASPKHDLDGNIIHRSIEKDETCERVEKLLFAFSILLPTAPQVLPYAVQTITMAKDIGLLQHASAFTLSVHRLRQLLRSLYRMVRWDPSTFTPLLSWTPLYTIILHSDPTVHAYTAHTISIVLGMSDNEQTTFLKQYITMGNDSPNPLALISLVEDEFDAVQEAHLFTAPMVSDSDTGREDLPITAEDLCQLTVDIAGILLPFASHASQNTSSHNALVPTLTTRRNLHGIALALSLNVPILLEGGPGVGKTALVEEAARLLGRHDKLLKIHLGDQTDAKVLLGTYVCTSTPGSFRWQPGVLTTAVMEGRWILFEDIDLAPLEVVSVLVPLLETGWLFVASRGEKVKAKEGFRVFGTRSVGAGRGVGGQAAGEGLWHKVPVKPLEEDEVVQVIEEKFPRLRSIGVQGEMMKTFRVIESLFKEKAVSGGRSTALRDLVKWCQRVDHLTKGRMAAVESQDRMDVDEQSDLTLEIREDLFREAVDCFTGMITTKAVRDGVLETIGSTLGILVHRVQFYADVHVPGLLSSDRSVTIGRVTLSMLPHDPLQATTQRPFAPTPSTVRLLERLAVSVAQNEPLLLVGETGTGKTTVIQHLAHLTKTPLTVINMSQQSDSSDLLGGFKPVDVKVLAVPVLDEFERLFGNTFSVKANVAFLEGIRKGFRKTRWNVFVKGCRMGVKMAEDVFAKMKAQVVGGEPQTKKKKTKRVYDAALEAEWQAFARTLATFENTQQKVSSSLLFSFIEGALVKAIREGHWVLLDEINLATPETLDCLTGLLASATSSLVLLERGDTEPVARHPGFRLFGCMNPANDAGKKELAPGLRGRFTEFWVDPPDATLSDLVGIIRQYLQSVLPPSTAGDDLCTDIATFYTTIRGLAAQGLIYDGADHRVHYSMRTLARALTFAVGTTVKGVWGVRRAVWEGCCMTFGTGLGDGSRENVDAALRTTAGKGINLGRGLRNPDGEGERKHANVGGYYLPLGPSPPADTSQLEQSYILTSTVTQNLSFLARAVMSGKYPVLIQGPTSAGKTSMVEYLAKLTGHVCVRVNNHEGTEVAEYIGGWGEAEDATESGRGRLIWQEGILVTALRKGHWLILDELNLAPSDVLESLNRLLDDNRELFIPETQETIRPHPSFMLFATQNPAGTTYGGRKQLSRAFRNRFLEIHFGDIPTPELHTILERRCQIAPSYAKRIVAVYKALQSTRGRGRVFEGRHGFVTLRDLFRWAGRGCVGYEELAEEGWCLLGERMRSDEDRAIVREVIEREMKVKVDVEGMYQRGFERVLAECAKGAVGGLVDKLVWTPTTKRLFTLVWKCVMHNEPVLLVGDTGAGKTTVCQVVAAMCGKELKIVNAHQGSEVGDFVGGMRPVRGREGMVEQAWEVLRAARCILGLGEEEEEDIQMALKFAEERIAESGDKIDEEVQKMVQKAKELWQKSQTLFAWRDGPLTMALRNGFHFLLDEISLADDSVLERLNSVLEPSQFLLLAEKGRAEALYAADGFRFLATMNPGGDYGKKELSPALRNRFCEIWVPGVTSRGDLEGLVAKKLTVGGLEAADAQLVSRWMMDFYDWLAGRLRKARDAIVSLRDVIAWVEFLVGIRRRDVMGLHEAFVHGGCMVVVDGIGVNPAFGVVGGVDVVRKEVRQALTNIPGGARVMDGCEFGEVTVTDELQRFGVDPFFIQKGPENVKEVQFSFMAPTTLRNLSRVLRALQLAKPVLLEGSPGVGKTSLITTLAHLTGYALTRINLSEQTDLTDLFGTDLPVEGTGNAGRFAWRDGPFLNAMKNGEWVLLDELNLASQQVLEGLNACLDHRGEVYIPELDRVFKKGAGFRVFAAQNPQGQGGGRKGLPRSFVNRFTSVYVEALSEADVGRIVNSVFGAGISPETVELMVRFNERMKEETMEKMRFGARGGPWEFNLRDVVRWVDLVKSGGDPRAYVEMMYVQRMRTRADQTKVRTLFAEVFGNNDEVRRPQWLVTENNVIIGNACVERKANRGGPGMHGSVPIEHLHIVPSTLPIMETVLKCVEMNYMPILTGPAGSGKTSLVRLLAGLCGVTLKEFSLNPGVDSVELLGGFEQADGVRRRRAVVEAMGRIVECVVRQLVLGAYEEGTRMAGQLMAEWDRVLGDLEKDTVGQLESFVTQLESIAGQMKLDLESKSVSTFSHIKALVEAYKETLVHGTHGTFEWIDGTLIRAMEEGHWILLDNVNLCPASVLDRLNPLLESGGVLSVTERGLDSDGKVRIVQKRGGFRIFMCLDERFGEVSRAMRNRGVEIFMDGEMHRNEEDTGRIVGGGAIMKAVKPVMQIVEQDGVAQSRKMRVFARMVLERVQRGESAEQVLKSSFNNIYGEEERKAAELVQLPPISDPDVLESFASPMFFPQFVSGRMHMEESTMARVLMDGSYLVYVLLTKPSVLDRQKLLSAAVKIFIEGTSFEDIALRKEWTAHVLEKLVDKADLQGKETLDMLLDFLHMDFREVSKLRRELCLQAGLSEKLFSKLPRDLRRLEGGVGERLRHASYWEAYMEAMNVFDIALRLWKMKFVEQKVGNNSANREVKNMSVIEKSRLHASFKIGETELGHPCVTIFWPLMEALRFAVQKWIESPTWENYVGQSPGLVHDVLDQREYLWECAQASDFNFEEAVVALKRLKKALVKCEPYVSCVEGDEDTARLRYLVERAAELCGLKSLEGIGMLWKHGSVALLKTAELFAVEQAFIAVNSRVNLWDDTTTWIWGGLGHPSGSLDVATKRTILEAVSTLYYLNEKSEQNADDQLLQVLREVPPRIIEKLDAMVNEVQEDAALIEASSVQQGASLVEMRTRVPLSVAHKLSTKVAKMGLWSVMDTVELKAELGVLTALAEIVADGGEQHDLKAVASAAVNVHTMALSETSRAPLGLEPLQRLIWLCDTENALAIDSDHLHSFTRVILQDAMYRWHRASWSNATSFWAETMTDSKIGKILDGAILDLLRDKEEVQMPLNKYGGPTVLNRGVVSRFALRLATRLDDVPIYGYRSKTEQIRDLANYLCSGVHERANEDTERRDLSLLLGSVLQFLRSHRKLFNEAAFEEILAAFRRLLGHVRNPIGSKGCSTDVEGIISAFDTVTSEQLKSRLHNYLKPCLLAVDEAMTGTSDVAMSCGRAWVLFSLAFLRSYIPDVPVDPASAPAIKMRFMEDTVEALQAEALVRKEMEILLTGNETNSMLQSLVQRMEEISSRGKKWASRVTMRPQRSQMVDILNDLQQLGSHLLSDTAVQTLLSELVGTVRQDVALSKEMHLQDTLSSLVNRLETKYPLYRDILQPVYLAVFRFKHGLRLIAQRGIVQEDENTRDLNRLIVRATRFLDEGKTTTAESLPILGRMTTKSHEDGADSGQTRINAVLSALQRMQAFSHIRAAASSDILHATHTLFAELVDAWSAVEQERLDKERAEESLYKFKERKHDLQTEEELDEGDFKERFPDFYGEFEDIIPKPTDGTEDKDGQNKPDNRLSEMIKFHHRVAQDSRILHKSIVLSWSRADNHRASSASFDDMWKAAFERSYAVASDVARIGNIFPSKMLDHSARGGHVYMASMQLDKLVTASGDERGAPATVTGSRYDFYKDPNVPEARRMYPILLSFDKRVGELLTQWPEHSVLLQLSTICERIATFSVTSPIMKLLTGLELLIQRCQDWEAYASRDVSLKGCIEEITELIVRWRKLELGSWRELLQIEDRKSEESTSKLWFHLWKVVVAIAIQDADEDGMGQNISVNGNSTALVKDLLAMLDQFCLSSSLGEFSTRLDMIETFYTHLCVVASEAHNLQRGQLKAVINVLHNAHRYYSLFADEVKTTIERLRKPILKELNGYVQIATWKDVNVYALKESANRTHHHLNKFVKKYRAILDMPAKDAMAAYHDNIMLIDGSRATRTIELLINRVNTRMEQSISKLSLPVPALANIETRETQEIATRLDELVKKMRIHTRTMVTDADVNAKCLAFDQLTANILDQIKEFQEVNVTLEAGSKAAKGQKAMRKKALVDMLKYVSYLGLSPRCSQRYVEQQDSAFVFALPAVSLREETLRAISKEKAWLAADTQELWSKADSYFYRVLTRMSKVRELQITASSDLSRTEVEKGVSYLEHLLHFAITQRRALAEFLTQYAPLAAVTAQIHELYRESDKHHFNDGIVAGATVVEVVSRVKGSLDDAVVMTSQALILVDAHSKATSKGAGVRATLEVCKQRLLELKQNADDIFTRYGSSNIPSITVTDMVKALVDKFVILSEMAETVQSLAAEHKEMTYIFDDLAMSLQNKVEDCQALFKRMFGSSKTDGDVEEPIFGFREQVNLVITAVLLSFQALMKGKSPHLPRADNPESDALEDEFGLSKGSLSETHKRVLAVFQSSVGAVYDALRDLIFKITAAGNSRKDMACLLQCLYPLLEQYLLAVQHRTFEGILQHKTVLKFSYVLCNTFAQLFKNGFCVPRDDGDNADDEGGVEDNVAGTGIGEGEGKKDVSDEIENEGQVEGMQNEVSAQPEPNQKIADEENGIEMDGDFEGQLEDVDAGDEEEDTDENGDDHNEEPEEQMGDVDGKANVVDEKLWGDDEDSGNGENEKMERDAPVQDTGGEMEMAAKEGGGKDEEEPPKQDGTEKRDNKKQKQETGPQNEGDENEGDDVEEMVNEDSEDKYKDNHGIDVKAPDERTEEQDGSEDGDMNLPDEMDLDDDEDAEDENQREEGNRGPDDAMGFDMGEDRKDPEEESAGDEPELDQNEEHDAPNQDEEDGADKVEAEALAEQDDQGMEDESSPMEEEKNNIQDSTHGFNEEPPEADAPAEGEESDAATQAVDNQIQSSAQPLGVKGATGEKSAADMQQEAGDEDQMQDGDNGRAAQESMQGADAGQQRPMPEESERKKPNKKDSSDTNPRRSLGDALKTWMSRLKDISDPTNEEERTSDRQQEADEPQQMGDQAIEFEFVKDDEQAADAQAMGDATAEQLGEMDRKALADDKEEKEYGNPDDDNMDVDETEEGTPEKAPEDVLNEPDRQARHRLDKPNGAIDLRKNETQDNEAADDQEKNVDEVNDNGDEGQVGSDDELATGLGRQHLLDQDDTSEEEDEIPDILDTRGYEELRTELEKSVAEWRESGQDPHEAQELWRMYTTLTRDLSFALCEQLRLILEPTLATKLKGDYRTGKRLNMRKIIPYIASQFKKDKIWLRRTKPSKRTYQIMIAIDDSRSMAESRSVQLAYESLAVITKALTQLEAGDVSVLSFGEEVRLLHPFEQPFSDDAGADVIRRFTFGQDRTHVRKMMDTALGILDHARSTSSAGKGSDLWQLQLVLSDGICEDHELVRSLVRRAAEQRIMVVFVVLDNRSEKDSITKMTNVTYGIDATGKPTLQMSRYMDTFPFDYYVVVKDIATLPEVLAEVLRQYFQFVNA